MTKVTLCFQINLLENDKCSEEKENFILVCHYTNQLNLDYKNRARERSFGGGEKVSQPSVCVQILINVVFKRSAVLPLPLQYPLHKILKKNCFGSVNIDCCYFYLASALVALSRSGFLPHICPVPPCILLLWGLSSLSRSEGGTAQLFQVDTEM